MKCLRLTLIVLKCTYIHQKKLLCSSRSYKSHKENAKLTDNGEGLEGVVGSIPFPNPTEALHYVWNHILRYRGVDISGSSPFFIVNPDGSRTYGAGEAIAKELLESICTK